MPNGILAPLHEAPEEGAELEDRVCVQILDATQYPVAEALSLPMLRERGREWRRSTSEIGESERSDSKRRRHSPGR